MSSKVKCADCKKRFSYFGEGYMVRNNLWAAFGVQRKYLCLSCFEVRLGRKLQGSDFTDCAMNEWNEQVQLLQKPKEE